MKSTVLCFSLLTVLLGSCAPKSEAPKPVGPVLPNDVISLRITGENLDGLGAQLRATGGAGEEGKHVALDAALAKEQIYATHASETIPVATVAHYRAGQKRYEFTATITFLNVKVGAATPAPNSRLRVEWLVNGQVAPGTSQPATAELTASSAAPEARAYLSTNTL
ncbi:hypothetical protein GCM10011495_40510 [Hymenobacter frigidus]|uniref:Uncharacterized protein n=1 Tax=Hymenobacter frigidus TaxID=1524095 RepID=A0ABQ2AIJ9_9BACT|nr:hypothetical protein [Hymenobacter frigidus]GGH91741.1 hypothetical protein GCM10011495_40510 [Hymenobacter frigidus]